MADSGSIDGRPEASEDGAGRGVTWTFRGEDEAGRDRPETTEEGLMADLDVVEREAREAREEAARLRARVAALEAARIEDHGQIAAAEGCIDALCDVLGIPGGARADRETAQSALDAVVSAAVAEERKRWATDAKSRIVGLHARGEMILADVLDAIDATEGGAP